jgi:hypothetical protein
MDATRPAHPLRSQRRYYRVDRRDISLLRFILEAYEGVATLTTIDPAGGVVMVTMAPGQEPIVTEVLALLGARRDIRLEPLAAPPRAAHDES